MYIHIATNNFGRILISDRLTANTPTILDVLDLFYGRKNVRLGVNGNPVVLSTIILLKGQYIMSPELGPKSRNSPIGIFTMINSELVAR